MISVGSLGWRPRRVAGSFISRAIVGLNKLVVVVLPVEFLLLKESGQHRQESAVKTSHLAIALRVVWRCVGVGDPQSCSSLWNNWFSDSPPWSWCILAGNPKRKMKSLYSLSAIVLADLLRVA